jgi:hypothetical protein
MAFDLASARVEARPKFDLASAKKDAPPDSAPRPARDTRGGLGAVLDVAEGLYEVPLSVLTGLHLQLRTRPAQAT